MCVGVQHHPGELKWGGGAGIAGVMMLNARSRPQDHSPDAAWPDPLHQTGSQETLFSWCLRTRLLCPPSCSEHPNRPAPWAGRWEPHILRYSLPSIMTLQALSWTLEPASPLCSPSALPVAVSAPESLDSEWMGEHSARSVLVAAAATPAG